MRLILEILCALVVVSALTACEAKSTGSKRAKRWTGAIGYKPHWRKNSYIYQPSNNPWKPRPDESIFKDDNADLPRQVFQSSGYEFNPYRKILDTRLAMGLDNPENDYAGNGARAFLGALSDGTSDVVGGMGDIDEYCSLYPGDMICIEQQALKKRRDRNNAWFGA